jgi:hypothetical protein
MRTTVDIPDPIYRQLKVRAAREGSSVKKLLLRGAEELLRGNSHKPSGKRVKLPIIPSKRPGTMRINNAIIDEILSLP